MEVACFAGAKRFEALTYVCSFNNETLTTEFKIEVERCQKLSKQITKKSRLCHFKTKVILNEEIKSKYFFSKFHHFVMQTILYQSKFKHGTDQSGPIVIKLFTDVIYEFS